jgi:hypothetical protein
VHVDVFKFVRYHKFLQNYMNSHLCFKTRILVRDDGPCGPKRVEIIDCIIIIIIIIIRLLCLTVMYEYVPVLKCDSTRLWIPLTE